MRSVHVHEVRPRRMPAAGFSLIELMIVVGVIAILAAIAYPNYQRHIVKTRRTAAAACLHERAQQLERFHTLHLSYLDMSGKPPDLVQCDADVAQHYRLSLSGVEARKFSLQATPQGAQAAADTRCGTLAINQLGIRSVSGTATDTPEECW
nr:type IV pilin protein [Pseudoxanthomonas sp.]